MFEVMQPWGAFHAKIFKAGVFTASIESFGGVSSQQTASTRGNHWKKAKGAMGKDR